jgi:hypothetical protein
VNLQTASGGSYDPFAPGATVTLLASGLRNAFDLVVQHTTGNLYLPTNGSAGGGNVPGIPPATDASFPTARCAKRVDGKAYNGPTGLFWPGGLTNLPDQNDFLFRVDPGASPTGTNPWRPFGYYGHPDPPRCEWIMGSGNPGSSNPFKGSKVSAYAPGTQADPNYRGYVFNFGYHASPNGVVEYRSHVFAGTAAGDLSGALLVARYSIPDDVLTLTLDANGNVTGPPRTLNVTTPLSSDYPNFDNPLDIVEDPSGSYATGRLYVSELDPQGGRTIIEVLRPQTS